MSWRESLNHSLYLLNKKYEIMVLFIIYHYQVRNLIIEEFQNKFHYRKIMTYKKVLD